MKTLLFSLLVLGSFSASANSFLFECHAKAAAAAKAIDGINFDINESSSVLITDRSQKKTSAKIEIALGSESNRNYLVRMIKNRSASLKGESVSEEAGCAIESVEIN
jgi:hypothetical protein